MPQTQNFLLIGVWGFIFVFILFWFHGWNTRDRAKVVKIIEGAQGCFQLDALDALGESYQ